MLSASSREKLLAFRKFSAGSHSIKRASPEFPRASNLSPRRKTLSSREIASFPGNLWGEGTLLIIQHNIRWLNFATEVRLELAIVIFSKEVFLI